MTHTHLPLTPDWLLWPQPWVWTLVLLALIPLWWVLWLRPSRRPVIRFSGLHVLRAAGGAWQRYPRLLLPTLRSAALICLIIAVARPQTPNESRRVMVEGIAIQMVVDVSGSMMDLDLSPRGKRMTRLDVVKDVFERFVVGDDDLPGRPDDLIGMIHFGQYADSVCPLTLDRDALLDVLRRTEIAVDRFGRPREEAQRTAIGDGLALAVERLKDLKRTTGSGQQLVITSRVVILLTDGENNAGMITPAEAGELAATFGIKVYTIMAGTGERLAFGTHRPIDDSELRHIAEVTGGRHFTARNRDSLQQVYAEIDELERTRTEEHSYVEWGELSWAWLLGAFLCLGIQTLFDSTWLRKIP